MKRCTRCGVEKAEEEFNKNRHWCKQCFSEYSKEYRLKNKEKISRTKKEYAADHKEEKIFRDRQYYLLNKERIKARIREHSKNNKEEKAARDRRYYLANKDKILPRVREWNRRYNALPEVKERKCDYMRTPKGRMARARGNHKRRTRLQNTECSLTLKQWDRIIKLQQNRCVLCGKLFTKKNPATRDHIVPISKGGSLTYENTQAVHGSCNSKKHNSLDRSNIVVWISALAQEV